MFRVLEKVGRLEGRRDWEMPSCGSLGRSASIERIDAGESYSDVTLRLAKASEGA